MSGKSLPEKISSLSNLCLVVGGVLTLVLLAFAFYQPNRYAHGVDPAPWVAGAVVDPALEGDDAHAEKAVHEEAAKPHEDEPHEEEADEDETTNQEGEPEHADTTNGAPVEVESANAAPAEVAPEGTNGAHAAEPEPVDAKAHPAAGHGAAATAKKHNVISRPFQEAWLIGWLFILAPTLGSFALLCIIHLTTGGWGFVIRRILEAAMKTWVPVMILFLPILIPVLMHQSFGDDHPKYEQVTNYDMWLDLDREDSHSITGKKVTYLSFPFFLVRLALYFLLWTIFTFVFYRWSVRQDETGDLKWRRRMKFWAGPCLLANVMCMSFFAFDWMMSMEPEWFSSIYGVIWLIGQGVSTFAFSLIMVSWLSQSAPIKDELWADRLHNIGNLQFAFIIIWTYVNVAQFIIIWSANLPEESTWYINRGYGLFQGITVFLFLFQFVVPFLILLSRHTKRHTKTVMLIGGWILFMRTIDIIWLIHPSVHGFESAYILGREVPGYSVYHVFLAVLAIVALSTLWFGLFLRNLKKLPLLPTRDPVFSPYYNYKDDLIEEPAQ